MYGILQAAHYQHKRGNPRGENRYKGKALSTLLCSDYRTSHGQFNWSLRLLTPEKRERLLSFSYSQLLPTEREKDGLLPLLFRGLEISALGYICPKMTSTGIRRPLGIRPFCFPRYGQSLLLRGRDDGWPIQPLMWRFRPMVSMSSMLRPISYNVIKGFVPEELDEDQRSSLHIVRQLSKDQLNSWLVKGNRRDQVFAWTGSISR